jgi:hypothetical protein
MANLLIRPGAEPMVVASNAKDMLLYIQNRTSDVDEQEKLMQCAQHYKKTKRRYALPVVVNLDRRTNDAFYSLDFKKIDDIMSHYINEYFNRLRQT